MAEMISTVAETFNDNSVRTPPQRSNFYAVGRYWVFYIHYFGTVYFRSCPDIGGWSPARSIGYADMGADFSVWFDGTYVHYTRTRWSERDNVYYRRGIPQPDGTISWSAAEQVAYYSGGNHCGDPVVTVDSNGYPYIAFLLYPPIYPPACYVIVLKSLTNDGTWVQDWSAELYSGAPWQLPCLTPLTLGKVYCTYGRDGFALRGRLWDSSSWGNEEYCTTVMMTGFWNSSSVVAIGDDVHIMYAMVGTYDLVHCKRTYGVGWGIETIVQPSTTALTAPALSRYGSELCCFWLGAPTPYHVYYKRYSNGLWDATPTDWIDESADGFPPSMNNALIQCSYEAQNDMIGVLYQTKVSVPYLIRHAIYSPLAPPPTYILTIRTIGQGTTDPAPGSWEYPEGSEVLVSAIPVAGWAFDHWEGSITGTENPITFTITSDMTITAVFSEIIVPPEEHAVTISVIGSGTTDPPTGAYTAIHETVFTVTAYPSSGWQFDHWEGSISGIDNPTTFTVSADMVIVAVFTEIVVPIHILAISVIGQGTTNPSPGSWDYLEGTEVLVSAIPDAGWAFDYWEGDISTTDNPVKVLMASDLSIAAVFSEVVIPPEEHAITISVIGEGMTDPVSGAYTIIHGSTLAVTAHPATGWNFSHWEGDISATTTTVNIEVLGDMSIVAVFVEVPPPPSKPIWVWPVVGVAAVIAVIAAIIKGKR